MVIRNMIVDDLEQVACLEQENFTLPWSVRGFADSLRQPNTIYLVAEDYAQIVGYCGLFWVLDEGEITNVSVAEAYRGQGVGRALLRRIFVLAAQVGVTSFTLEVRRGNHVAIHLYESLGFSKQGIRPDFYQQPKEDALIMWKK